jgi:Flp pilus assembly protein CpaB
MDVATARRLERPAWINGRVILGLVLFVVSFVGAQRLLAAADETVQIWTVRVDLPQGAELSASDLQTTEVKLTSETLSSYFTSEQDLTGMRITRPLHSGELVPRALVSEAGTEASFRDMTIPVTPEHAVGGDVGPGDRVDIYATFDAGDIRARTVPLLMDVDVAGVVQGGGLAIADDALLGITVRVSPKDAARLAFAIRTADIDIAVGDGVPGADSNGSVSGADFR